LRKQKEATGVTARGTEKVTVKVTDNQSGILKEMLKDKYTTAVKLSKIIGISERKSKKISRIL
jgi:hypothetical protein